MNEITKVSDITANDLADYIRLYETTTDDLLTLNNLLTVATTFIQHYTGRTQAELVGCCGYGEDRKTFLNFTQTHP